MIKDYLGDCFSSVEYLASVASILKDWIILNCCNRFYKTFYCWRDTSASILVYIHK